MNRSMHYLLGQGFNLSSSSRLSPCSDPRLWCSMLLLTHTPTYAQARNPTARFTIDGRTQGNDGDDRAWKQRRKIYTRGRGVSFAQWVIHVATVNSDLGNEGSPQIPSPNTPQWNLGKEENEAEGAHGKLGNKPPCRTHEKFFSLFYSFSLLNQMNLGKKDWMKHRYGAPLKPNWGKHPCTMSASRFARQPCGLHSFCCTGAMLASRPVPDNRRIWKEAFLSFPFPPTGAFHEGFDCIDAAGFGRFVNQTLGTLAPETAKAGQSPNLTFQET